MNGERLARMFLPRAVLHSPEQTYDKYGSTSTRFWLGRGKNKANGCLSRAVRAGAVAVRRRR
jgi:hypothetical protein